VSACDLPEPQRVSAETVAGRLERRGLAWMMGAFIFCPCHLPITLAVLGVMLGGTAAGALLRGHPYLAGAIVTAVWAIGTWRGYSLVRSAQRFAYNSRRHGVSKPVS
jgi:mercuric ion transport protein